jgi:hypothetical protein
MKLNDFNQFLGAASDRANAMAVRSISAWESLRAQIVLTNGAFLPLSHRRSSRRAAGISLVGIRHNG